MPARHRDEDLPGVDLKPVMSILVVLVPILLFAFSFYEVRIQQVTAPRMTPGGKPTAALNLTVLVTDKGFAVTGADDSIPAEGLAISRTAEGQLDYAALGETLTSLKKRFPAVRRVNVGAEGEVPWHIVSRTLDTARAGSGAAPMELFPEVAFVVMD